MTRNILWLLVYVCLLSRLSPLAVSQTSAELESYFKNAAGLTAEQIAVVHGGKAIGKALKSRISDEIFVFGVVYIKAAPESYIKFANDFDRLKKLPEFLAIRKFSDPPQVSDLEGFTFDSEDIKVLKACKPHDCDIQMPAEAIEDVHKSIDWSAPDLSQKINQRLHERVIERMQAYRLEGNRALGVYADKENFVDVSKQFEYMLSYVQVLPKVLPDFHHYLLAYPSGKAANIEDQFYWAKVKFGLKPTLRVIQIASVRGQSPSEPAYTIAEKQLYSSHYFETALDLTFCVRDPDNPQLGFYLIKAMGSEQSGLTGFKGSIVRKVAVSRTASSLEKSLAAIKNMLETTQ
jgi:hypothetical protein